MRWRLVIKDGMPNHDRTHVMEVPGGMVLSREVGVGEVTTVAMVFVPASPETAKAWALAATQ